MKKLVLTAVILMSFSTAALADIARPSTPKPTETPKQRKSIDTTLSIMLTKTKTAKLKIPRSQIAQLRAQMDELDGGGNNTAAVSRSGGFTRLQTIVSGAFLSLALVFGGLWFARTRKIDTKGARGLAIVLANAGPPDEARSITGKIFTEAVHSYKQASGEIKLMVSDEEGDRIVLVVPDPTGFADRDEE